MELFEQEDTAAADIQMNKSFFRSDLGNVTVEEVDVNGNLDMESAVSCNYANNHKPTHLLLTVNGIIGCAEDWRYAAKQFLEKYPQDIIVHCSECNSSTLTFDGIDVMGSRLAEEVISVVKRHPNLQKISFLGHSLGGLIARYAIAKLYAHDFKKKTYHENGDSVVSKDLRREEKVKGSIAGLEPINFITVASPHLGLRGHGQVPLFWGFHILEKLASRISWLLGRTGEQQFLTDTDTGKLPLLLQMAQDCDDLKYISALQSFKRRVTYSNAHYDYVVGWCTSSLRRQNELPKVRTASRAFRSRISRPSYLCLQDHHFSENSRYPHIIYEETSETDNSRKEAQVDDEKTDDMEEAMLQGLTKVTWERVDVSFTGSIQRLFAHSTIQVKTPSIHYDGADVVEHMVDNFLL